MNHLNNLLNDLITKQIHFNKKKFEFKYSSDPYTSKTKSIDSIKK